METKHELEEQSIPKLLIKFSVPAFLAVLVNAIYNVVDRAFIGKVVGEEALAGLTMVFPIILIIFSLAVLIAGGGANLISICLGEKNKQKANIIFTHVIILAIALGIILSLIGYLSINFSLEIFKAEHQVYLYAKEYLEIIYLGVIFQIMAYVLGSVVRAEGFPMKSMIAILVAALLNIALDYLFISILGKGVAGAAWATIIAQFVSLLILLEHFISRKSNLYLIFHKFRIEYNLLSSIIKLGGTSFIVTFANGFAMIIMAVFLSRHGGTSSVALFGAISSFAVLLLRPIFGILFGMQPIIGYNYGAKQFHRVRSTFIHANKFNFIVSSIIMAIVFIFPEACLQIFIDGESASITEGTLWLKTFICMFPLIGINILGSGYYQAINKSGKAFVLGGIRQLFLFLPILLLMAYFWGLPGIWLATPVADLVAIIISLVYITNDMKKLRKQVQLAPVTA